LETTAPHAGAAEAPEEKPDPVPVPECEVRAQLDRILGSRAFAGSERARRFLTYVVEQALAGKASHIKAYSIATDVFGRDSTFDPQSDPIVRIDAGRLRRTLDRYYSNAGDDDRILITIPKGGYAPVFAARPSTQAAPSPPPEQSESGAGERVPGIRNGRLFLVLAGIAVAAIVLVVAVREFLAPFAFLNGREPNAFAGRPDVARLAVEPFTNLMAMKDGTSVAMGLTEEIIGPLARFKEITVIEQEPRALAAATGDMGTVRYVLSGTVLIDRGAVRVSARVTNREDDSVLWAASYSGDLRVRRLLDIEGDIARGIAIALAQPYGVIFQADSKRSPENAPDDWRAYACTLSYYSSRTTLNPASHVSVKDCLEETIARFPRYATAWALLSLTFLDEVRYSFPADIDQPPSLERALDAARHAVELEPTNVRGLQAEMLSLFFNGQTEDSLDVGERALALNPNDTEFLGEFGFRLALSGKWARGCPMIAQSLKRSPSPLGYFETALSLCFYMEGDYARAVRGIERADLDQNSIYHLIAAAAYGQLGDAPAAARERQWAMANAPRLVAEIRHEVAKRILSPSDQVHFLEGLEKAGFALPTR
jgi:TolB-like protein